jgi:hypothetical protein
MSDLKTDGGSGRDSGAATPWRRLLQTWRRRKLLVSAAITGGLLVAGLAAAEIGARAIGAVDFATYDANPVTGYIPTASTSGRLLGRDWVFNEHHMGVAAPFAPTPATDVVLIGDSLVYGTSSYRQTQRLGPDLQALSGVTVWPIGAGSWSVANEVAYLNANPDVVAGADRLVFIVNYADIQSGSVWKSDLTHPRHHPLSAVAYLAAKILFKPASEAPRFGEEAPVLAGWQNFTARYGRPIDVILYPDKAMLTDPAKLKAYRDRLALLTAPNIVFHDLTRDPRWTTEDYMDSIHPRPDSVAKVARFMTEELHLDGAR